MGKAVFRGEKGRTKRHDYRAGVKFTLKRTKTISKGKAVVVAKPKRIEINTGSMFESRLVNVEALGSDAIKIPNTKKTKQIKRATTMVGK